MTAPQVPDSASPYWLRLYGHWVRLQGIMPVVNQTSQRGFSELITVDGHRHEQRAPRGPRSWALDYRYATAAATAALESAAYDYNFDDPDMRTLMYDQNAAKVNMVPPDLLGQWKGDPEAVGAHQVVDVSGADGLPMWLPTYGVDAEEPTSPYWEIEIPVRGGVEYTIAGWIIELPVGSVAIAVTGAATVNIMGSTPAGTPSDPHLGSATVTPVADGVLTIQVAMGLVAGLMVYEGDCPPTSYRAGQRMPCAVAVQDPSRVTNLIWRDCDPCTLPREHTAWVIHEVAADAVTPMDVGVS